MRAGEMKARGLLVTLVALLLLMFGPFLPDYLGLPGLFWRTAYLVLIPLLVWGGVEWIWRQRKPDPETEDRFARSVVGAISGGLFVGAVLLTQGDSHEECTRWVTSRDGKECVGEWVRVAGADWFGVIIAAVAGLVAFSISSAVKTDEGHRPGA